MGCAERYASLDSESGGVAVGRRLGEPRLGWVLGTLSRFSRGLALLDPSHPSLSISSRFSGALCGY